ncbi:MAG: alpha/beta hydrolase [Granulosicoccus sp.]|nr:alpha/beta hydrolase [Granulosicoccus sp.]
MHRFYSSAYQSGERRTVIALHCSGGSPKQWQILTEALTDRYRVHTPRYLPADACNQSLHHSRFSLDDEARLVLPLLLADDKPVHMVGHSYGGALALYLACCHPERVASLSLFEPCAFHILSQLGAIATKEQEDLRDLATSIVSLIDCDRSVDAMRTFVDFWGGSGAWHKLKASDQAQLVSWAPKALHEFDALFNDSTPLQSYRRLNVPVLLLHGEDSPRAVKTVANALWGLLPAATSIRLSRVGHMGPVTHRDAVARLITSHINQIDGLSYREMLADSDSVSSAAPGETIETKYRFRRHQRETVDTHTVHRGQAQALIETVSN